ncbi:MAG: ester cyclase [Planctomycetota bacterium]
MSAAVEIVRSFYEDIWNRGDLEAATRLCAEDLVFRGSLGDSSVGRDAFLDYVRRVRGALDDYRCVIEETVVEGDRVFARMTFSGLSAGPLLGHAPTHRRVSWAGAARFLLREGRIADLWVLGDRRDLESQLARPWGGDGCSG